MAKVVAAKIVKEFLEKIVSEIGLEVEVKVKEEEELVKAEIKGDSLGALIGYHGETLESLELILSLMLRQKLGGEEWKRVVVDIGDWKKERQVALKEMIDREVQNLRNNDLKEVPLPIMSSSQRREAHLLISENYPDLKSESVGEEPNRRIVLKT